MDLKTFKEKIEKIKTQLEQGPKVPVDPGEVGDFVLIEEITYSVEVEGTAELLDWILRELEHVIHHYDVKENR